MTLAAPDGWVLTTGAWGTDADRDDTLSQTGNHALHLKATAVATTILGPWMPVRGGWNNTYALWAILRASNTSTGRDVTVKVQGYQADRATTTTAAYAINATPLNAAGVWEYHGDNVTFSAATRWARFEISKAAVVFDVYCDSIAMEKFPPGGRIGDSTVVIASSASWTTPNMGTQTWFSEANFDAANERIEILVPGIYMISAEAEWTGLSDGDYVEMRVVENAAGAGVIYHATSCPVGAAGTKHDIAAREVALVPGDTLELQVRQQTGGDRTLALYSLNAARIGSPAG